ncbi:MAG: hypothetical protein JSV88_07195 [Candidatus Aminicenantes bacterium]|nr:MAG: hypothetical protein JSV88_07195 [Candidatus Aminicenantes bacterium]
MERIVHIAKSFEEAEQWDIEQNLAMTPDDRLEAAKELKERVYGKNPPDVREVYIQSR